MTDMQRHTFDSYFMHHFFSDVYSNARTGVLKVYFPQDIIKTVYFSEGNTIYASSNGEKDKLVNILVKYKKLTREQLETALRQMDKSISLGRNLVNMGFITHKELIWAVKVQVIGIMHSIITLREGEYQFNEGPLPDGVINLPLNTMKVLFDSLLMFQDRAWISQQVHYPSAVYKKTILFEEGKNRLITNAELLDVAEAIDGQKTVEELAGISNIEDFKIFKLLYALRFLNLIEEKVEEPALAEQGDQIFEMADEPEEALELAEESLGQLARQAEETEDKELPVELEKAATEHVSDEIPLTEITEESEQEGVAIGASPDATLIETIRPGAAETDTDSAMNLPETPAMPSPKEAPGADDVYVEFQLDSSPSQSVDETQPMGIPSGQPDEDTARLEDAPVPSVREGIALTEEDLDSVILEDGEPADDKSETVRIERDHPAGPLTDQQAIHSEDESADYSEEIIMPPSSGGNWLLLLMILVTVVVGSAAMYYYKFYLPEQSGSDTLSVGEPRPTNDTVQVPSPDTDVTAESFTIDTEGQLTVADKDVMPAERKETAPSESEAESSPDNVHEVDSDRPGTTVDTPTPSLSSEPEPTTTSDDTVTAAGPPSTTTPQVSNPSTSVVTPSSDTESIATSSHSAETSDGNLVSSQSAAQLQSGAVAYEAFVQQARDAMQHASGQFTLQLEIACQPETIEQAIRLLQPNSRLYLVPFRLGATPCYIVAFGIYPDRASAQQALDRVPEIFFENNEPFVASVDSLRRRLQ